MQCHTLDFEGLWDGLPVLEHPFFVDGVVPNSRHNPVVTVGGLVYSATLIHIQPRGGGNPFWVLGAQNVKAVVGRRGSLELKGRTPGHLVLVLGASEFQDTKDESGYRSNIDTIAERNNDDGTKDLLLAIRNGIYRVVQKGTPCYLNCNSRRDTLKCLSESEYRRILKRDAEKEVREAEKHALVEVEEKRWTKRSEEVSVVGNISVFRHHSGVSLFKRQYRVTDTYIEVEVPGDQEKPALTISVDTAIRQQTDWKVITGRRFDALAQTRPAQIKLIGKREFEEHDDGKRRNVVTWYEPDPAELKVWIARAQDVVSLSKPVVVK
jgi:hypothetical protein